MNSRFRFAGGFLALALSASWIGCGGTRPDNTPRLSEDLYHTVVFKYDRVETRRYADTASVRDFVRRLNRARADSMLETVRGPCWISLQGREGAQQVNASGKDFRISGAGCRFRQAHCNYRADFDLEALCRPR
jgi:hypothetical protein